MQAVYRRARVLVTSRRIARLRPIPAFTMAQKFSTSGAQTAGVLLRTIPEAQQVVIAQELTTKLRSNFDDAAASVAIELIAGRDDEALRHDFLHVLKLRIQHGSPDNVSSLLTSFPELSNRMVAVAANHLIKPEQHATAEPPVERTANLIIEDHQEGLEGIETDSQEASSFAALQWLRFAKVALPNGRIHEHGNSLFSSALKYLSDTNRSTALAARDLIFSLLPSETGQNNLQAVRSTISSLITARDLKLQQTLGYALWMRLLAASDEIDLSSIDLIDEAYWTPLLHGLRNGDAERRKMCLDILKRSTALAIEQGKFGAVARTDNGKFFTACSMHATYPRSCCCI